MRLSQAVHLVRRKLTEEFEEEQSSLIEGRYRQALARFPAVMTLAHISIALDPEAMETLESFPRPSWGPSDPSEEAVPRQT